MNIKKIGIVAATVLAAFSLAACQQPKVADHLLNMTYEEKEDAVAIAYGGRTYFPYGTVDKIDLSTQIGVIDKDQNDCVYEYKDYLDEDWIAEMYHSGEMDNPMLYKEESVTVIPDELLPISQYRDMNK